MISSTHLGQKIFVCLFHFGFFPNQSQMLNFCEFSDSETRKQQKNFSPQWAHFFFLLVSSFAPRSEILNHTWKSVSVTHSVGHWLVRGHSGDREGSAGQVTCWQAFALVLGGTTRAGLIGVLTLFVMPQSPKSLGPARNHFCSSVPLKRLFRIGEER